MKTKVRKSKKKLNPRKISELVRREQEIETYGKLLSFRGSQCHRDKTKYTRKQKHKGNEN